MPGEKFGEQAKRQLLYEFQGGDDVGHMLEQGATNSRVNESMTRFCLVAQRVNEVWRGKYKDMFAKMVEDLQRHYLNLEGYSRVQAIDMRAAHTITEKALLEKKEKGGIIGLLGG